MIPLRICLAIVYLTGAVYAYYLSRREHGDKGLEWTVGDRRQTLAISLLSWGAVGLYYFITATADSRFFNAKNKASW